ncbi:MAG: tetratricopeptide repeat protein, partial [Myxococcota bacterium]
MIHLRVTTEPAAPIPRLLRLIRNLNPAMEGDRGAQRGSLSAYAGDVVEQVLEALCAEPTAILVDELHRAEPVAFDVLRALGRRIEESALLLVAATESQPDQSPAWKLLSDRVQVSRLKPLGRAGVKALIQERLAQLDVPMPALVRISDDSRGMPSLVERILARLLTEETIVADANGYRFVGGRYVASSYDDAELTTERLAALDDRLLFTLRAAAVLGSYVDAERVAYVSEFRLDETEGHLAELVRLELLMPTQAARRATYRFVRRNLHSATYGAIPTELRRTLHDRAADAVGSGRRSGLRLEERVEHLLKGSNDELAVQAAIDAGDRAARVFADRRAIEYYARAFARLKGNADSRAGPISLRLGRLFERTGELERASVWYQAAIAASGGNHGLALEAQLNLGGVALVRGFPEQAARSATEAEKLHLESNEPRLSIALQRLRGRVAMLGGAFSDAVAMLEDGRALAKEHNLEHSAVANEVLLDLARVSRQRGSLVETVRWARSAERLAKRRRDSALAAESSMLISQAFVRGGRLRSANRSLLVAIRDARASGDRLREATVLREIGHVRFLDGNLHGALEHYEKSLELVRASQARSHEAMVLHDLGRVRALSGDFSPAQTALRAACEAAGDSGELRSLIKAQIGLAMTSIALGDESTSRVALDESRAIIASLAVPVME